MPKLLALGGPRHGRLVFIDAGSRELSFQLMPPDPTDRPIVARYRRSSVDGEEVLVHDDVPGSADLAALLADARASQEASGQWDDDG